MKFIKKHVKIFVLALLALVMIISGIIIMKTRNPYKSEGYRGFYYRTYADGKWSKWCENGQECGTKGKVITNIEFKERNTKDGLLFYSVAKNGVFTGLLDEKSKLSDKVNNIDGIAFALSDKLYEKYIINYRTYTTKYGWLAYSNGDDVLLNGTGVNGVNGTGIEKIQIKIIKRTSNIDINDDSKQKSSYGFEFDNTTEDQENAEEIAE